MIYTMININIQEDWIDSFISTFLLNGVKKENKIAILCESQSRQNLVELSKIALNNSNLYCSVSVMTGISSLLHKNIDLSG